MRDAGTLSSKTTLRPPGGRGRGGNKMLFAEIGSHLPLSASLLFPLRNEKRQHDS